MNEISKQHAGGGQGVFREVRVRVAGSCLQDGDGGR